MASFDDAGQMGLGQVRYSNHRQYHGAPQGGTGAGEGSRLPGLGSIGRAVNFLGAAASVALIVGIGVWGYKLVMRDVSGVPVVRAIEGPMRVQPENPGGTPADHQGLAVNRVAAQGTAAPPAERLILAPKPVTLADEDAPMGDLNPKPVESASQEGLSLADAQPAPPPAVPVEEGPAIDPADLAANQPQVALLDEPGVAASPRPPRRPARATPSGSKTVPSAQAATSQSAIDAAVRAAVGLDVAPDTLAVGTRLAQLGAFDSPEIARAEWDRLNAKFGDYMSGKQRVIQKTSSGGRTFYRLRALGFDDLGDTRRFCAALSARGADCIPVAVR